MRRYIDVDIFDYSLIATEICGKWTLWHREGTQEKDRAQKREIARRRRGERVFTRADISVEETESNFVVGKSG